MEDFAKEARREFSRSLAGYVNDCVYPSLVERGLMRVDETTRMGVFRRRRSVLTPDGHDAAAELDEWLRVGRDRVEGWARSSPEHALAYAGGAGAAILLMPELYPEFERLGRHVLTQGEPAVPVGEGSGPFDFGLSAAIPMRAAASTRSTPSTPSTASTRAWTPAATVEAAGAATVEAASASLQRPAAPPGVPSRRPSFAAQRVWIARARTAATAASAAAAAMIHGPGPPRSKNDAAGASSTLLSCSAGGDAVAATGTAVSRTRLIAALTWVTSVASGPRSDSSTCASSRSRRGDGVPRSPDSGSRLAGRSRVGSGPNGSAYWSTAG